MIQSLVTIDSSLRLVFARLEGALGVRFSPVEVDRVFTDAINDQRDDKHYTFYHSGRIQVTGLVGEYEPETIEITVEAPRLMVKRVQPILAAENDYQ